MPAPVTSSLVWDALSRSSFAVLSWVNAKGQPRSAGIVYVLRNRKLYVGADRLSWKARHIHKNPNVAVNATFPRRLLLLPWVHIPDASIAFHGTARVLDTSDVEPEIASALTKGLADPDKVLATMCVIEISPVGTFVTYGIGVSTMQMRDPEKAQGRVSVN